MERDGSIPIKGSSNDQHVLQLYGNNQGANSLAYNPGFHSRTKHIDVLHYWISQRVELGYFEVGYFNVAYVRTEQMSADGLTTGLASLGLTNLCTLVGPGDVEEGVY